jgi:hypothetical protein
MEYRAKGRFELLSYLLLNGLVWVGVAGIAWNLLKPAGWLYRFIDLLINGQPASLYYAGVGALALLAGKAWLDSIDRRAVRYALSASCAFAGTLFILRLVLPL